MLSGTPAAARTTPFPHVVCSPLLNEATADAAITWFETSAPWKLKVASFYQQYECNLHEAVLTERMAALVAPEFVRKLSERMLGPISGDELALTEVNAHKLVVGQTIRIHNDYLGGDETHRILVQLNRGWDDANGGLLMLFSGPRAEDLARILRPTHCSAASFEISPTSFHAVSTVHSGERFTLVYSFTRAVPGDR